jgi:hypothetical protein
MAHRALLLALQVLLVAVVVSCGESPAAARPTPSPRPSPTMTAADKAELAQLEARPLKLPTLLPGGVCQADGVDPSTGLYGADPVYAVGGPHSSSSFGDYFDVSAITKPGLVGPVLLRGRDLKVADHPIVFLGPNSAGPVYGTDPAMGTQYTELALDTAHPPNTVYPVAGTNYYQWFWRQGIAKGWSYCVGFQIDGPTFSEVFNANVPPG